MLDSMHGASEDATTLSLYFTLPVNLRLLLRCLQNSFQTLCELWCPNECSGSVHQRERTPAPPSRGQAVGSPSEAILA